VVPYQIHTKSKGFKITSTFRVVPYQIHTKSKGSRWASAVCLSLVGGYGWWLCLVVMVGGYGWWLWLVVPNPTAQNRQCCLSEPTHISMVYRPPSIATSRWFTGHPRLQHLDGVQATLDCNILPHCLQTFCPPAMASKPPALCTELKGSARTIFIHHIFFINGVCTVLFVRKSPNIRSYTVI